MENISETLNFIKETILKHVPAKYIYLFGSHAYDEPIIGLLRKLAMTIWIFMIDFKLNYYNHPLPLQL